LNTEYLSKQKEPPNIGSSRTAAGRFACAIYKYFPHLERILLPSRVHARPSASQRKPLGVPLKEGNMSMHQELVFPLNKFRIIARFVLQVIFFVGLGFLLAYVMRNPAEDKIINFVMLVFSFGSMIYFLPIMFLSFSKIIGKQPGLVIDSNGIVDNTTEMSAGRISWSNIASVNVTKLGIVPMLTIEVHDLEKIFEQGNILNRILKRINRTPFIAIAADSLGVNPNELANAIEQYRKKYGKVNSISE
jgi:hypothetical protein